MKKITFFALAIALILSGCDKMGKDNVDTDKQKHLNPPAWIHGVWLDEGLSLLGLKFTEDDVIIVTGGQGLSMKATLSINGEVIRQDSNDSSYNLKIQYTKINAQGKPYYEYVECYCKKLPDDKIAWKTQENEKENILAKKNN